MLNTDRLCPGCMNDNGGEPICPVCGYDSAQPNPDSCLPAKFLLGDRYLTGRVLEINSEGITYLGRDNTTGDTVHIREYFPRGAARRFPDATVSIAQDSKFLFNDGLMDFLELNRALIGSTLPALLPVTAVFEENGTAYAVAQTVSGITLQSFLTKNGGSLKWEQARPLFLPLIDTIVGLHELGLRHGAISPDTVLVGRDGKMRLDHIAISKIRDAASGFEPELYPGYAAIEQYGAEGMTLTEATDVYGLASTLFRVLIGSVPPAAPDRVEKDSLAIPAHFAEELPRQVLVALANGMQIRPAARTATIDAFRNELVYGETAEQERIAARRSAAAERQTAAPAEKKVAKGKKKKGSGARAAVIAAVCTAVVFLAVAVLVVKLINNQLARSAESDAGSSASDVMPEVPNVGDVDSNVAQTVTRYTVPNLVGKFYSEISEIEGTDKLKFSIIGKEFSDKYERGTICKQSIAADTQVERGAEVQLTISLGPQSFSIANVIGLTEEQAKLELLKQGFLYGNIEVVSVYDTEKKPGVVLEQTPAFGTPVSADDVVQIQINDYAGETDEDTSSSGTSNSTGSSGGSTASKR